MGKPPKSLQFSHFGFYVKDLPRMTAFYTQVLGFQITDKGVVRGRNIVFLSRDIRDHHQVVLVERQDGADEPQINQLSFRVDSLDDLRAMHKTVASHPDVSQHYTTDHGVAWSIYFLDPEKNRIEIFVDTPWYVDQPRVDPLDLAQDDAEIRRRTLAAIEKNPTFMPLAEWKAKFQRKLDAAAS